MIVFYKQCFNPKEGLILVDFRLQANLFLMICPQIPNYLMVFFSSLTVNPPDS